MNLKEKLSTRTGIIITATVLTAVVLLESIFPPWAPYFIIYAVLAILVPLLLRSFRFASIKEVFKRHWKITLLIFLVGLIWDQGICTFLLEKILGLAGVADNPFYSLTAALTALSESASLKFGMSPDDAMMIFGAFVVLWAPVGEELFYRGYMQGLLKKTGGVKSAIFISAAFFGIRHMTHFFYLAPDVPWIASVTWALSAFGFGLLMSYLYEKTESLWPPIIVHAAVNIFGMAFSM